MFKQLENTLSNIVRLLTGNSKRLNELEAKVGQLNGLMLTITENEADEFDHYTRDEVARLLSVHKDTVRNANENGELEFVNFGRSIRISKVALKKYLALKNNKR